MPVATKPDITSIVQHYALKETDKARLASLIAHAYLLAKAQAYQKAVATTEHIARITQPWIPGKHDAAQAQAWAQKQVESIANTYEQTIRRLLEQVLQEEPQRGLVSNLITVAAVAAGMTVGVKAFITWKAPQIADYTWNKGGNDGTSQWIEDVQGGDVEWVDDSVQDLSKFQITVVPDSSSSDFCADWAGNSYPIEQASEIPQFPAHINCIHSIEISVV